MEPACFGGQPSLFSIKVVLKLTPLVLAVPFEALCEVGPCQPKLRRSEGWRYLANRFKDGNIEFTLNLSRIQAAFKALGLKLTL